MNESKKRKLLLKLVKQYAGNKDVEINDETKLFEDLGYDSFRIIELLSNIEERCHKEFEEFTNLIDAMNTVKDFVDFFVKII